MLLPQDIIDCIISQFGREAPRSRDLVEDYHALWTPLIRADSRRQASTALKTFCLVSRDCRRTAVRYLFHTVEFTGRTREMLGRRLDLFHQLLCTSSSAELHSLEPKAAACIRTLSIKRDLLDSYLGFTHNPSSFDYLFGDGFLEKIFENLVQGCATQIWCLRIDLGQPKLSIPWEDLPPSFLKSVEVLIRSPNLKILSLLNIKNLPHTIFHQSSLEALQLAIFSSTSSASVTNTFVHIPKIDFLLTNDEYSGSFMETPWWRIALANLKGCNVDLSYEVNASLLEFCRRSLQSLRLDRIDWSMFSKYSQLTSFNPFNFGLYTNLRTLSITRSRHGVFGFTKFTQDRDCMKLVRMLQATDPCPNLHTLILRIFDFNDDSAEEDFLVPYDSAEEDFLVPCPPPGQLSVWEELDMVVASSRFPDLRRFRLEISADIVESTSGDLDIRKMGKIMTKCFKRSFTRTKALQRVELEYVLQDIYLHSI